VLEVLRVLKVLGVLKVLRGAHRYVVDCRATENGLLILANGPILRTIEYSSTDQLPLIIDRPIV
jgi:hypothetical protein